MTGYIEEGYPELANPVLIKTDSDGVEEWSKSFRRNGPAWMNDIIETSDDGYIMAGQNGSSGSDFWVIKTDSAGNEGGKRER